MIKNYLLVALRSLSKNKNYVVINTLGLGVALACCITAYLILAFNIEFDDFFADKKVGRIFRIHTHIAENEDGKIVQNNNAPLPLAHFASQEISGIERYTRYVSDGSYMRNGEKAFAQRIAFTDSTFFDMFHYPLISGDHKAFKDKYNIFLTEKTARKYFGDEPALGKTLILNFANDFETQVVVGGVVEDFPVNNSFPFEVVMRIENLQDIHKLADDNWGDWRDPSTFLEINSASNASDISKQLAKYIPIRNEAKQDTRVTEYRLEHFKSYFTYDDVGWGYSNLRMGAAPIIVFTAMASLILLIACFNLTNTSIAMTAKRLKEVGIRKAVGAIRYQIVSQFLLETILTITFSLIIGLLLAQWIVPVFTRMWDLPYSLREMSGLNLFISVVILVFIAALLAGIYPALFNSKFKPVALLKGQVQFKGTNGLTQTLVAFQFALSVIVLVGGVVFIQNTKFQQKVNFGYDKEMVITVEVQSKGEFEAMESAIRLDPKILEVSVSDNHVGWSSYQFPVKIDTAEYTAQLMGFGKNYFETMGFRLKEGRFPNLDNASDQNEALVVNQAFLDKINLTDAMDKTIIVHDIKRHIVGIVENHVDNLFRSKEAEPFVFYPALPISLKMMQVRGEPNDLANIKQFLESTWKKLYPTKPFESKYQEDIVMQEIKTVNGNLEKIFIFLTVLGGLLSVSGIFSLATLNIAKRTKEIGIRKALGASVSNVVALLNKEFVIILILAAIAGSVSGFYLTDALLTEIYAYHVPVGVLPVVICALFIFCIGLVTTSFTIFKAARANPVNTLRSE